MRWHQPTIDYVTRRAVQGLSKKDIIRCLKRFVAREIYNALITDYQARVELAEAVGHLDRWSSSTVPDPMRCNRIAEENLSTDANRLCYM